MKVGLHPSLSDAHIDANQPSTQRQLSLAISAIADSQDQNLPLNLCLVLDHSGSMHGKPLETVKKAALNLVENLKPHDRLAVIAFDHRAKVLISNQEAQDIQVFRDAIRKLKAGGGTAIDEGMKLAIEESFKGRQDRVSQIFLLTDGENEHGDNDRCLKLAKTSADENITLSTLGFGDHWNQDVLEAIADAAGGTMAYIEQAADAISEFSRLFNRAQSVGLTNAHVILELIPEVRLAELKPMAQVAPETIELTPQWEGDKILVRLGDLLTTDSRIVLANLYISGLNPGSHTIARVQIRYDDPALGQENLYSETMNVIAEVQAAYSPEPNPEVQKSVLALAKYRQTQLAEQKLQQGDRLGAATMLQTAAKTAIQMGDEGGATILQNNATRLQSGEEMSAADQKRTRIVSKTILQ
jgi:Ca-activated chloride channel family protein